MDDPFIKILLEHWAFPFFQEGSPEGAQLLNNRFTKRGLITAQALFLRVALAASIFSFFL